MSSENIIDGTECDSKTPPTTSDDGLQKESLPGVLSEEKIQELDTAYRILMEIIKQNKTTCWPFMEKVDIKGLGLWDYEVKVKEPMWLNKITEKFEKGEYPGITEFARDFRMMVENCYRYNNTDHAISKKAKRLEMVFEAKLALLKKDYRDKTSLSVTSNGKYAVDMNGDSLAPVSRYGRLGNTREYASVLDDDSAKLVYDFVRCEETMFQEDEKKASYRERRQQEFLYQRIAAAWINSAIEEHSEINSIKTCHTLPEVAFFLHLCETTLKFPELNMYHFERSLLVPEFSNYLSKIMTALLCSYQERSQISQRPPMHFGTWNRRLKERLQKWFELVQKYDSYTATAEKLGINVEFFQSLEWKNPFFAENFDNFSQLKYDQKAQVLKALCDSLFPLQSVQNALFSLDTHQLQCMPLGKDYLGNVYIYFPQFCGDEVRIYRHREFGVPVPIEVPEQIWTPPKPPSPVPDSNENSPLVNGHDTDEGDVDEAKPAPDEASESVATAKPVPDEASESAATSKPDPDEASESMATDSQISNCDSSIKEELMDDDSLSTIDMSQESIADSVSTAASIADSTSTATSDFDMLSGIASKEDPDFLTEKSNNSGAVNGSSKDVPHVERRTKRVRKQTARYEDSTTFRKRSTRKKNPAADKNDMESKSVSPKKRKKADTPIKPKKEAPVKYGNVDFELLCDTVDAIQLLISALESQQTKENKSLYGRNAFENQQELIDKVRWLYDELEPWNIKLQKARLSVQIQMKKEHDEIQNSARKFDPWMEELTSKNIYAFGDNITISHVDSPMSSVTSFDDDEDYIHPYFTRKLTRPNTPEIVRQFDETLYEEERETLLPAALSELEEILKKNIKDLLKLADHSELQENNSVNDGRRTRQKIKQQNKILGQIITFAEKKVEYHPSLLPILVPNSDVYDAVDMIYLQEEARLQEIADENRRKRLARNSRRKKSKNEEVPELEIVTTLKTQSPMRGTSTVTNKPGPETISIRMQNGRIYPATRLSDGRVIPIQREKNSVAASSVEELIESTQKEIRKNAVNEVPTISLRRVMTPEKNSEMSRQMSLAPKNDDTVALQTVSLFQPTTNLAPAKVTVKRTPKKIVVTQPLQRIITKSNAIQSSLNTSAPSHSRPVAVTQILRNNPVQPIILNGQRYSLVSGTPTLSIGQQPSMIMAGTTKTVPIVFSQPTAVVQPRVLLTPFQVVNPAIKYQSSPIRTSKPGGVVLVPVRSCAAVTAPVLGVITSPQRQLQFQPEQNKP